mmetsp:Transcript_40932/g.87924  ORF Transcript_40932/g.87924 Transcript_40932/m.87924 type:complete len:214 (-) Transcript_40932:699-1340(-)
MSGGGRGVSVPSSASSTSIDRQFSTNSARQYLSSMAKARRCSQSSSTLRSSCVRKLCCSMRCSPSAWSRWSAGRGSWAQAAKSMSAPSSSPMEPSSPSASSSSTSPWLLWGSPFASVRAKARICFRSIATFGAMTSIWRYHSKQRRKWPNSALNRSLLLATDSKATTCLPDPSASTSHWRRCRLLSRKIGKFSMSRSMQAANLTCRRRAMMDE